MHQKVYPGDTLRFRCIYDSSDQTNETIYGKESPDEMCQIYIGDINQIDNFSMVYSVPNEGANAVLSPSYCGLYQQSAFWVRTAYWRELIDTPFIFQNTAQLSSSSNDLRVEDDIPELCRLILESKAGFLSTNLIWRVNVPIFTLQPAIAIGVGILVFLKLTEYGLSRFQPGCYSQIADSVENKRKITIYINSIIFYSIILYMLLWEMCWNATSSLTDDICVFVHDEFGDDNSTELPYGMGTAGNLSVVFLFMELLYRVKVC